MPLLSRGRLELVIGKGNELRQLPMFGIENGDQWAALEEKYELLRRLWRGENVTWQGRFRGPLHEVTSLPRPFAGAPRIWHGSATTLTSAELAAKWGDPLFSANAIQPHDNYTVLINQPGNHTPGNEMTFATIDDAIARGPVLVGSPQQIAEKILWFHEAFGHDLQSFSLPTMIPHEQQLNMLERLASEVIPIVRRAASTTLWGDQDPYGGRPAVHGRTVVDAAAEVEASRT